MIDQGFLKEKKREMMMLLLNVSLWLRSFKLSVREFRGLLVKKESEREWSEYRREGEKEKWLWLMYKK